MESNFSFLLFITGKPGITEVSPIKIRKMFEGIRCGIESP